MTLNFMQQFEDGSPTLFVEKITKGLWINHPLGSVFDIVNMFVNCPFKSVKDKYPELMYNDDSRKLWDKIGEPKIHTIRSGNRWEEGMNIHFKIWTGKPYKDKTFNFAPIVKCTWVQDIKIIQQPDEPIILIDGVVLDTDEKTELAINDGFKNLEHFNKWFNEDFNGQIIHWIKKDNF